MAGPVFAMPWSRLIVPLAQGIGASPLHAASSRRLLNLRQNASRTSTEASFGPTPLMRVSAAIIAASASAELPIGRQDVAFLAACDGVTLRANGLQLFDYDPKASDLAANLVLQSRSERATITGDELDESLVGAGGARIEANDPLRH